MDIRYNNPCVNFIDVCTKSCTVKTCMLFCFSWNISVDKSPPRQENESPDWATKTMLRKIHHDIAIDTLQFSQINLLVWHIAWVIYLIKCKTIFDHFTLYLQMLFKSFLSYYWNKGQKGWNIVYKTYGHYGFCSDYVINNLGKQNIECFIFPRMFKYSWFLIIASIFSELLSSVRPINRFFNSHFLIFAC